MEDRESSKSSVQTMKTLKQYLKIQLGTAVTFLLAGGLYLNSGDWWVGGFLTASGLIFGYSYYQALREEEVGSGD